MNRQEAYAFLEEARQTRGMVLGLDNMRELMRLLGNPQDKVRYIQIAGTNGKGSVTAYLANILFEAGMTTGRYVSPAVFSFEEQFQVNGTDITPDEAAEGITAVAEAAEKMEIRPTSFEMETALAFWYFAKRGCSIAVIETGLGGDMDATNIVTTTVCSVITSISIDHSRILGSTLSEIASHKAGIIKEGVPVVCLEQSGGAWDVVRRTAAEKKAKLYPVYKKDARMIFSNKKEAVIFYKKYEDLHIRQLGFCQKDNAAIALETADVLRKIYPEITDAAVRRGMEKTYWRGRFEIIPGTPELVLDGAHNPDGVKQLRDAISRYFAPGEVTYITGVLGDKDYDKEIAMLYRNAAKVYTVTPPSPRALDKALLKKAIHQRYPQLKVVEAESVEAALDAAMSENRTVVVCGTLTIMKDADEWIKARKRDSNGLREN